MDNFEPTIRNAAHALIIRNNQILLLRKGGDERGERYALPGGAQEPGETLHQALYRECQEEIDAEIEILNLLYVADYFKQRSASPDTTRHQIEFLFSCAVSEAYQPHNGPHPDGHQLAVNWVSLNKLYDIPLLPRSIATLLTEPEQADNEVYRGLIT